MALQEGSPARLGLPPGAGSGAGGRSGWGTDPATSPATCGTCKEATLGPALRLHLVAVRTAGAVLLRVTGLRDNVVLGLVKASAQYGASGGVKGDSHCAGASRTAWRAKTVWAGDTWCMARHCDCDGSRDRTDHCDRGSGGRLGPLGGVHGPRLAREMLRRGRGLRRKPGGWRRKWLD